MRRPPVGSTALQTLKSIALSLTSTFRSSETTPPQIHNFFCLPSCSRTACPVGPTSTATAVVEASGFKSLELLRLPDHGSSHSTTLARLALELAVQELELLKIKAISTFKLTSQTYISAPGWFSRHAYPRDYFGVGLGNKSRQVLENTALSYLKLWISKRNTSISMYILYCISAGDPSEWAAFKHLLVLCNPSSFPQIRCEYANLLSISRAFNSVLLIILLNVWSSLPGQRGSTTWSPRKIGMRWKE